MGRKKKYLTEEDKHEAEKRWMMEHYWRNKEVLKEKALVRYYKNKDEKGRDI